MAPVAAHQQVGARLRQQHGGAHRERQRAAPPPARLPQEQPQPAEYRKPKGPAREDRQRRDRPRRRRDMMRERDQTAQCLFGDPPRTEESREGKEWVSTCKSKRAPTPKKK